MTRTRSIRTRSTWCVGIALLLISQSVLAETKSPIADAAERQDFAIVRALLETADVNVPQRDGMTALHWAVYHDDFDVTTDLIKVGATADCANQYGVKPLSLACQNSNAKIVTLLLDSGADPNSTRPGGETVLMTASRTGRLTSVESLIERGADVNATERRGQTALMWAAAEGHEQVVDALLNAKADWRVELRSGFNAFFFAVREGHTDVVLGLLSAGTDINETMRSRGGSPGRRSRRTNGLLMAVENGHFELARELLSRGADPNAHPAGYTALHAMTWVRKPIRGDGDPSPQGSGNLGGLDFVRHLVDEGAYLDARLEGGTSGRGRFTTTGSTPFLLAARASDVPLMKLLLELGADPKLPNADNSSPLLAAAGVGALGDGDESAGTEAEALAAVRLLLELDADINTVDDNGETAMHGAAYQSREDVVRLLAEHRADIDVWNRKNKWGWTPLLIAEGHRPGNLRPAPATIEAIHDIMLANGIEPPPPTLEPNKRDGY